MLPFRYEDRRSFSRAADLLPGAPPTTLSLRVVSARLIRTRRRGFTIFRALLADDSGSVEGLWYNQPYLQRVLTPQRRVVVLSRPAETSR